MGHACTPYVSDRHERRAALRTTLSDIALTGMECVADAASHSLIGSFRHNLTVIDADMKDVYWLRCAVGEWPTGRQFFVSGAWNPLFAGRPKSERLIGDPRGRPPATAAQAVGRPRPATTPFQSRKISATLCPRLALSHCWPALAYRPFTARSLRGRWQPATSATSHRRLQAAVGPWSAQTRPRHPHPLPSGPPRLRRTLAPRP